MLYEKMTEKIAKLKQMSGDNDGTYYLDPNRQYLLVKQSRTSNNIMVVALEENFMVSFHGACCCF